MAAASHRVRRRSSPKGGELGVTVDRPFPLTGADRAHLTLQGNFIWGLKAPELHIDGETFGFPAGAAGATVGIRSPSGDGRRGGDLRIWFRIGPTPGVRASGRRRSTSTSKRTRQP
jgi:hypothetical protein